eukprot:scaffold23499_cov109-Cylindrotheca_fusiformis.AAC.5
MLRTPTIRSRSSGNAREDENTPTKFNSSLHQNHNSSSSPLKPYSPPKDVWAESPSANLKTDHSMALLLESTDEEEDDDVKAKANRVRAVPGRATRQRRRKKKANPKTAPRRKSSKTFLQRLYLKRIQPFVIKPVGRVSSLVLAVLLWYSLGIISISTSKWLLLQSKLPVGSNRYYYHVGGVAPLVLTTQQLALGSTFLRFLLSIRCLQSPGIQPLASLCTRNKNKSSASSPAPIAGSSLRARRHMMAFKDVSSLETIKLLIQHQHTRYLCLAGICFSLGFFCTNLGFHSASASFVETIKASEPITSAILAVSWGLEVLTNVEVTSLATIICGVLLSTLGNAPSNNDSVGASFLSCTIVMASNLCFSFRGLYQKLFQSRSSHSVLMDDLNLQYRMQQMGMIVFIVPTILWEGPSVVEHIYQVWTKVGLVTSGIMLRYIGLSILNAVAFASYNLASTYLLSRISVVHHAALNCIRRIFAIVVTSVVFANPISMTGVLVCCFKTTKLQEITSRLPSTVAVPRCGELSALWQREEHDIGWGGEMTGLFCLHLSPQERVA